MNILQSLNSWILDNQAVVISAGIPIFTLVVTGWASFLSHRAKVAETRLNGRVKLSEYRRNNFDELLRVSGRLQSLFFEVAMKNSRNPQQPPNSHDVISTEIIECGNIFLLRSQANLEQVKHFSGCLHKCIDVIITGKIGEDPGKSLVALRVICKEILDQEWILIVKELEGTTP